MVPRMSINDLLLFALALSGGVLSVVLVRMLWCSFLYWKDPAIDKDYWFRG